MTKRSDRSYTPFESGSDNEKRYYERSRSPPLQKDKYRNKMIYEKDYSHYERKPVKERLIFEKSYSPYCKREKQVEKNYSPFGRDTYKKEAVEPRPCEKSYSNFEEYPIERKFYDKDDYPYKEKRKKKKNIEREYSPGEIVEDSYEEAYYPPKKEKKHKKNKSKHRVGSKEGEGKKRKRKRFESPIKSQNLDMSFDDRSNKKNSRWGDSQCKVSQHLRYEDALVYSLQMQLNEVTNKLAQKNYASEYELMRKLPEPDPIYGPDGKRLNTKEQRARERLENRKKDIMIQLHELRPDLVQNVDKLIANRAYDKVFIPQDEYPDINFAGLIIGPRGMTQKELEKETETKIILRGKGSVKVAKMAGTGQSLPGDDEPLHAYITSSRKENVAMAAEKIYKIVQDAIEHPELENELRKNQMKQLAIINGTYRETEGLNKLKMKEEINSIVTNTMICSLCGGTGHLPRDCKIGNMTLDPTNVDFRDPEYKEFLSSIGKSLESYEVEQPTEPQGVSNFIKNFVFKT